MATTSRTETRGAQTSSRRGAPQLPTRQRRPGLIALAVLLIVGCGLAGGWLFVRGSDKVEVVAAARPVAAGHALAAADLTTTSVAGMPNAIPAAKLNSLVGQHAVSALVPGEVLLPAMVTSAVIPKPGQALVGVTVQPGQMPAGGLHTGDVVTAVLASSGDNGNGSSPVSSGTSPQIVATRVVVYDTRAAADAATSGATVVTLLVAERDAAQLSVYGSAGELALVAVNAKPGERP